MGMSLEGEDGTGRASRGPFESAFASQDPDGLVGWSPPPPSQPTSYDFGRHGQAAGSGGARKEHLLGACEQGVSAEGLFWSPSLALTQPPPLHRLPLALPFDGQVGDPPQGLYLPLTTGGTLGSPGIPKSPRC